jgi:3-deoxy-D-manno-octulosonic-acid transferase
MFFFIYRFVSFVFLPFIKILVFYRVYKGLDDKKRYQERFGWASQKRPLDKKEVLWFHAASVGESLSLLSIIHLWQERFPQKQILLTTITRSAAKVLQNRLPAGCIHQYAPFDVYCWVTRFINHWKPEKLIMVESEIWPNILAICDKKKIPVILLNAKLSARSFRRWRKITFIAKQIFRKFQAIYAQSAQTQEYYNQLGCKNIYVMPHLKYMADSLPYNENRAKDLKMAIENRNVWLAVSTHPLEEEILCRWHEKLKQDYPYLLLVIIPRHAERIPDLYKTLDKIFPSLNFSIYSKEPLPSLTTDVYIVDTLGDVGLFCSQVPIVFLGGTLVPIGGHNPLEPLILGASVICGPYVHGITTLIEDLKNTLFLSGAKHDGFIHLKHLLQNPAEGHALTEKAQAIITIQKEKIKNLLMEEIIG